MVSTNVPDVAAIIPQEDMMQQRKSAAMRAVFLILLFVVVFTAVRFTLHPINSFDYNIYSKAIEVMWEGQNPFYIRGYFNPPWTTFLLTPLIHQPLETWLALTVAIFVVSVVDRGHPASLLMLAHPVFIVLIASSNPEWILVGTGLWLLELSPRGWGRGVAWLFLAGKPQTVWLLLIFEGIVALRQHDWKPFLLAVVVAVVTFAITPMSFELLSARSASNTWSLPIVFNYGVFGAAIVTAFIVLVRWKRRADYKSLGLILSLVWTPYALQYAFMTMLFIMRKAGWLRTILFVVAGIVLAGLFWDEYHVQEEIGAAGMLLLAAIMAPSNEQKTVNAIEPR